MILLHLSCKRLRSISFDLGFSDIMSRAPLASLFIETLYKTAIRPTLHWRL